MNFPWGWTGIGAKWNEHNMRGSAQIGIDTQAASKFDAWMAAAGFTNIEHRVFLIPHGPWVQDPKLMKISELARQSCYDGMEGFSRSMFTKVLGWSQAEVDEIVAKVRHELMQDGHRWYSY